MLVITTHVRPGYGQAVTFDGTRGTKHKPRRPSPRHLPPASATQGSTVPAGTTDHENDDHSWAKEMVRGLPPMRYPDVEGLVCLRKMTGREATEMWRESA